MTPASPRAPRRRCVSSPTIAQQDEHELIAERRRERRRVEEERRAGRRRRGILLAAGVAALGAIAAVALLSAGGGDPRAPAKGQGAENPAAVEERAQVDPAGGAEPGPRYKGSVPVLMYHAISEPPPGTALPELFVSAKDFRSQVDFLAAQGYEAVTLDRLHTAWTEGAEMPGRPVVLTFDDGLLTQYTDAFPVLEKLGWPGVLNLKVESLEQGELTDGMVEKMLADGWELGSHTISHADVTTLTDEELEREVAGSRRTLSRRFGVPVNSFCYPAGAYDERAIEAVEAAGYLNATTTEPGLASRRDPYRLARVRVDGSDGVGGLAEKLAAAGA